MKVTLTIEDESPGVIAVDLKRLLEADVRYNPTEEQLYVKKLVGETPTDAELRLTSIKVEP